MKKLFMVCVFISIHSLYCLDQQKIYNQLVKKLGYDPEVTTFHHLRRLVFDHNKGEYGQDFFDTLPITGYVHGLGETGDYAYEFSVTDEIANVYSFNFPKYATQEEYEDNKVKNAKIALQIADYIQTIYPRTCISFFCANLQAFSLLHYLMSEIDQCRRVRLYDSLMCINKEHEKKHLENMRKYTQQKIQRREDDVERVRQSLLPAHNEYNRIIFFNSDVSFQWIRNKFAYKNEREDLEGYTNNNEVQRLLSVRNSIQSVMVGNNLCKLQ